VEFKKCNKKSRKKLMQGARKKLEKERDELEKRFY
jgi:hypothetical protein